MWFYVVVFIVALVVAYAMTPKPQNTAQTPAGLDDVTAPTAEVGREIPVLFGTKLITGSNLVWYGDLFVLPIQK